MHRAVGIVAVLAIGPMGCAAPAGDADGGSPGEDGGGAADAQEPTSDAGTDVPRLDARYHAEPEEGPEAWETGAVFGCGEQPGVDLGPVEPLFMCDVRGGAPVRAGLPLPLDVYSDRCLCGGELRCDVRVEPPGVVRVRTVYCGDARGECECLDPPRRVSVGRCLVPGLDAGMWEVWVDGRFGFTLESSTTPPDPEVERLGVCWELAPKLEPGIRCDVGGEPAETPNRFCHPSRNPFGVPRPIDVTYECRACGEQAAGCRTTAVRERRWGWRLHAAPRIRTCDCPRARPCSPLQVRCHTPPVAFGPHTEWSRGGWRNSGFTASAGSLAATTFRVTGDLPGVVPKVCLKSTGGSYFTTP